MTYSYYVDAPGDNLGPGALETTWHTEFRRIQGDMRRPVHARFPPTVYVHFRWVDRDAGRLQIQYWFYYPYDKFVNNHEGDAEHIGVFLRLPKSGDDRFDPRRVAVENYHYHFHGSYMVVGADEAIRFASRGGGPGDHALVVCGGYSALKFGSQVWTGFYSGASWPWPGYYRKVGVGAVGWEDTRHVARTIHADDIRVIVLPEPEFVDYNANPELSWLNLDYRLGQPRVEANVAFMLLVNRGINAPAQFARKGAWKTPLHESKPWSRLSEADIAAFDDPPGWTRLASGKQPPPKTETDEEF